MNCALEISKLDISEALPAFGLVRWHIVHKDIVQFNICSHHSVRY